MGSGSVSLSSETSLVSVIPERFKGLYVVAPAAPHTHPDLQMHVFAEHLFNIDACKPSDFAQFCAALTDHNRFVAFALNNKARVNLRFLVVLLPALDRHRDAVGKFVP